MLSWPRLLQQNRGKRVRRRSGVSRMMMGACCVTSRHGGTSSSGDLETVREHSGAAAVTSCHRRLRFTLCSRSPTPRVPGTPPFLEPHSLSVPSAPPTLLPLPSNTAHRQPPTPRTVQGQGLLLRMEGASVSLPQGATLFHGLGRLS